MTPESFAECLIDRVDEGQFFVHPRAYSDPDVLRLEIEHIFSKTWCFLTHESEIRRPNDFITTYIVNTPILVTRDRSGAVCAMINACRHKGAVVCAHTKGNAPVHVCRYHAWSYDSSGKLMAMRDRSTGAYPESFRDLDHGLVRLPKVASYRGFVFGSMSSDAPPLDEFLGDMRFFLDLIVDRYPEGIEFVAGTTSYSYRANWKLQLENGMDAYHLGTAHNTLIEIQNRRRAGLGNQDVKDVAFWRNFNSMPQGIMSFEHGHTLLWTGQLSEASRPEDVAAEKVRPSVGDLKADWMRRGRNYYFFPNMQIQDSQSLMLRIFRPLAVDLTEMTTYCMAPVDEPDELRMWRLRQYEDFFNASGLASPDDSTLYEWCQEGYSAIGMPHMQGYARGLGDLVPGPDELARQIGAKPALTVSGPMNIYNETGPVQPFRAWFRMISEGMRRQAGAT